jgi:hypothetical protein
VAEPQMLRSLDKKKTGQKRCERRNLKTPETITAHN